jgi:hypothetical protein
MTASEEQEIGSLLLAVATHSYGNYVLIRTGQSPGEPRHKEWRVNIRRGVRDEYSDYTTVSAADLRTALEQAHRLLTAGGQALGS